MGKQDISRDALGRIEYIDRTWAASEYRRLSPEAKRLFDDEVNKIFWLRNPERYNKKLDPSRLEDKPYRDSWVKISHSLIGSTGAQFWENKVKENQSLREDIRRYSDKLNESLNRQLEKEKPLTSTERAVKGILRQEYTGQEFLDYIEKSFKEPYAEPEQVAFNIVRYAEQRHLVNASRDPKGKEGLFKLHELLISNPDNNEYIHQANRIIAAIGSLSDPSTGLLDKPYVFPAEFTLFNSSHITARLTEDNKIWVKLTEHSIAGHPEALSLGGEAFTKGIILEPHEWVRFKLYDEGGITVCRPAIYLLQLSNKSTKETWSNIINVGSLGLPGGPLFRVGGIIGKTGSRVLTVLSKLEKAADIAANGFMLGNIAVRENRGWIIKNYGDNGRKFIEYFDIATIVATCYGVGKALSTPVMRKSLEKMIKNWDDIKKTGVDSEDIAKISEIDKSVNQFKAVLKECDEIEDTVKVVDEGAERTVHVDDSVSTRLENTQVREAARVLDRTQEINNVLRNIETDPDFIVWRQKRNISENEFRNWIHSIPEESRIDIMERILDKSSTNSLRIKRFVLRDAAHEIRVNKELKKMGIDQVHGDFIGPGHKGKEGIAELLSRQSDKGDPAVKAAVDAHGDGRIHHNPVSADDHLHQALDQYDAVTDKMRTEPEYGGYRKDTMKDDEIRRIFVDGEKDVFKKRAMEAVLDYKEKGVDPKRVRREYHEFFDNAKTRERINPRDGGGGKPPGSGPEFSTTQLQPKEVSDLSQTSPPLPFSKVNVKYLGEELADKMNKMGIDENLLDEYIWRLNWESSKGDVTEIYLGRVQEGVKKTISEQVDTSLTLGENLSSKLVNYGYDPSDISATIKDLTENGMNPSQVRETLRKETLMMDYLRDQLHGGSQSDAKISLIVSDGNVKTAIKHKLWENMVEEWNNANPKIGPGSERLAQFSEKAEQMAKDIERKVLGSTLTSGAVITQSRKEDKEPIRETQKEANRQIKDVSERNKLFIRENKNKVQQKNLKEKPKHMKPSF
jgi:hypothetical protein